MYHPEALPCDHSSTSDAAVSFTELFSSVAPETPVEFNPHGHLSENSQENCDSDLSVTPYTPLAI